MPRNPDLPRWRAHTAELVVLAVAVVVILGLWLANRGDGDDATLSSTTSTAQAPGDTGPTVTAAPGDDGGDGGDATTDGGGSRSLDAAKLRQGDLPGGWVAGTTDGATSPLCAGQDPLGASAPTATARAVFTSGSKIIGGTVAGFSSTEKAKALLQQVRSATAACAAAGGGATYRIVEIADVGDESLGVTFSVPTDNGTATGLLYVARVGNRSAVIASTSIGAPVDAALALAALRAESARL